MAGGEGRGGLGVGVGWGGWLGGVEKGREEGIETCAHKICVVGLATPVVSLLCSVALWHFFKVHFVIAFLGRVEFKELERELAQGENFFLWCGISGNLCFACLKFDWIFAYNYVHVWNWAWLSSVTLALQYCCFHNHPTPHTHTHTHIYLHTPFHAPSTHTVIPATPTPTHTHAVDMFWIKKMERKKQHNLKSCSV